MSKPVHVALFTDSRHPSGVGRVVETLARHLPTERYRLFLACAADTNIDEFAARLAPHVAGTVRCTVRDDVEDLDALHSLVCRLREWRIDIFHNHIGATWEGAWGTLAARCARVPVVVATEHLPNVLRIPHELEYRSRINRLLDRLFTVSESVRESLVGAGLVSPERVVTVENGVESGCPAGDPALPLHLEFGLSERVPTALFLGRLVEQKDPATLLRAVRILALAGKPFQLLLAGEGPLRGELEELACRLEIAERVRFLGNRNDVDRLLTSADVLAMPSRFEGLPMAALEAMSHGLPVVGCEAPGVKDAVLHNVNGWLAPVGDHEELARGLLLAAAEEPGRRWGQAALDRFARHFTAHAMVERYHGQYEALLHAVVPPSAGSCSAQPNGASVRDSGVLALTTSLRRNARPVGYGAGDPS